IKTMWRILGILGLLFAGSTCVWADIRWDLTNVMFANGDSATGYFTTNTAVNTVTSFNIVVSGPAVAYDFTAVKAASGYLPTHVGFGDTPYTKYINLVFASPMTANGATVVLTTASVLCGPGQSCSKLVTGTLV